MSTIIDIPIAPSNDNPISLPITATPGDYKAILTAGGRPYVFDVTVGASDVQMPNVFQQNSFNKLTIYESDGVTILDDTEYNVSVTRTQSTSVNDAYQFEITSTAGQSTLTNAAFAGASDISVFADGTLQPQTHASPDDDFVTFTNRLPGDQTLIIKVLR